jgi:hypothetical protein
MMKIVARGLAVVLVAGGLLSTLYPNMGHSSRFIETKALTQNMPIPVCPPNDPNACHIDKW